MSKIDDVLQRVEKDYFYQLSDANQVRILDTPHVWGVEFGRAIMPAAQPC